MTENMKLKRSQIVLHRPRELTEADDSPKRMNLPLPSGPVHTRRSAPLIRHHAMEHTAVNGVFTQLTRNVYVLCELGQNESEQNQLSAK